ncbi:MAG TPA: right-handed parallel beta-helix repeat-containing protein [Solirubrobacterales bacterium]|nr:right-handed parallel beta-helix repeat-containing protein [Solirubrobacterales bacterium]
MGFPSAAAAQDPVKVSTESELRQAWENPRTRAIELIDDIYLQACRSGEPIRESQVPLTVDGNGHTLRQTCFEKRLLRQDGTGYLLIEDIALTRGGNDGPGAALTTRGELTMRHVRVVQNLAEEPGGGVFSMRRVTVYDSVFTGNLANDDGGAIYARRGGVQVYDSLINSNLVDGSGGAIGSTGDILVVRSRVLGSTTDGDGGALYADEDGDITVLDSTVNGNTADGPGGAIFTLEGDVTVVNSTVDGNRADDRGGAISGEADVTILNSTIARNAAVAHVGGGIWSRGDAFITNSTVTDNYAEGQGGGVLAAGTLGLTYSTVTDNSASQAGDVGAGGRLRAFGSIIGPPDTTSEAGHVQRTTRTCEVPALSHSSGYNFITDSSCFTAANTEPTDIVGVADPALGPLSPNPEIGASLIPEPGSPVLNQIPPGACDVVPFGEDLEGEQHLGQFGIDPVAPVDADQRHVPRPQGGECDIGAVERGPADGSSSGAEGIDAPTVANGPAPVPRVSSLPAPNASGGNATDKPAQGSIEAKLDRLARFLRPLTQAANRFRKWRRCISHVPVSELGDPDHRFGFAYDERDGTAADRRAALTVDRKRGRPDYAFLRFASRRGCRSAPVVPGGTAEPARALAKTTRGRLGAGAPEPDAGRAASGGGDKAGIGALERRLRRLERRAGKVERDAERFDEWESCLSWVPVTEYGDPDGWFGYRFRTGSGELGYRAALAVDISEWDDPDYQFLAFAGVDRPFARRECESEPGEGVDRVAAAGPAARSMSGVPEVVSTARREAQASAKHRRRDLLHEIRSFREDLEDLVEPIGEFEIFDQCMFTIAVSAYGGGGGDAGYVYRKGQTRPALAMDMRGFDRGQYDFMGFPGEEPPQIECNEDASGFETDE